MKKFYLDRKEYLMPTKQVELTREQLLHVLVCQMYFGHQVETVHKLAWKIKLLRGLVAIPDKVFLALNPAQILTLLNMAAWALKVEIKSKPFEYFSAFDEHGVMQYFYLPDAGFGNSSSIEVALGNTYYLSFVKGYDAKQKELLLNKLLATFCRPERLDIETFRRGKDWNGDRREEYNSVKADERAEKWIGKISFGEQMAFLKYFELMNNAFIGQYKSVFEGGNEEEEPLFANGEGWLVTLEDVAKVGVLGDLNRVWETNVHTIFLYLRHEQVKMREAERRAEEAEEAH